MRAFSGRPTIDHGAVEVQQCAGRDRASVTALAVLMMRSRELARSLHRRLVARQEEVGRAQAVAVLLLAGRVADQRHVGAHRGGDLDAHVAEAAEADDADAHARAGLPLGSGW